MRISVVLSTVCLFFIPRFCQSSDDERVANSPESLLIHSSYSIINDYNYADGDAFDAYGKGGNGYLRHGGDYGMIIESNGRYVAQGMLWNVPKDFGNADSEGMGLQEDFPEGMETRSYLEEIQDQNIIQELAPPTNPKGKNSEDSIEEDEDIDLDDILLEDLQGGLQDDDILRDEDTITFQPVNSALPEFTSLCALDISDPDDNSIETISTQTNGVTYTEYITKDDLSIITVMDRAQILWVSGGRRITSISSYEVVDSRLVSIHFYNIRKMESEFFERLDDGTWKEIDDKEFEAKVCKITRGFSQPVVEMGSQSVDAEPPVDTTPGAAHSVDAKKADIQPSEEEVPLLRLVDIWSQKVPESDQPISHDRSLPKHYALVDDPEEPIQANQTLQNDEGQGTVIPIVPAKTRKTIDLCRPNGVAYRFFDYVFAGNLIRLIVPQKDVYVAKLVNGSEEIWTPAKGGALDYAKVYLDKDNKPVVILVIMGISGCTLQRYYEFRDGKWEESKWCYDEKIMQLKQTVEHTSGFVIDIENQRDTSECRIFEVSLLGVNTRHFFPKPTFLAKAVTYGEHALWKAAGCGETCMTCGYHDHCLSVKIHRRRTTRLLEITVSEANGRAYKHFKKIKKGWRAISLEEFFRGLTEMRGEYKRM